MENLSQTLSEQLAGLFAQHGIAMNPPVSFQVNGGNVIAQGQRGDLDSIMELINNSEDIKDNIEKLAYVTEEMSSFVQAGHLEFSRAYQQAGNPQNVVNQYAHLFNGANMPPAKSTINFNGQVSMSCQGKEVNAQSFINNPNWIEANGFNDV